MKTFERALSQFEDTNTQVLGVNCDSVAVHKAFAAETGATYPLLSDWEPKGEVTRLYGVFNPERGAPFRSTFIVDKEGVVRYKAIHPQGTLPNPSELVAELKKLEASR